MFHAFLKTIPLSIRARLNTDHSVSQWDTGTLNSNKNSAGLHCIWLPAALIKHRCTPFFRRKTFTLLKSFGLCIFLTLRSIPYRSIRVSSMLWLWDVLLVPPHWSQMYHCHIYFRTCSQSAGRVFHLDAWEFTVHTCLNSEISLLSVLSLHYHLNICVSFAWPQNLLFGFIY